SPVCESTVPGTKSRFTQVSFAGGGGGVTVMCLLHASLSTILVWLPGSLTYTFTVTVDDFVKVWVTGVLGLLSVTVALPSPKSYTTFSILALFPAEASVVNL